MIYSATKIIATLGPASSSEKVIESLIKAGVNIFRLNFSHGDFESHGMLINRIRKLSSRLKIPVGIMQDLPGPKIRLGLLPIPVKLERGHKIILESGAKVSRNNAIPVQYGRFHRDVSPGGLVYIDDGTIRLKVLKISGENVSCLVEIGGMVSSHKGVNLPGTDISAPSLTTYDRKCLKFGIDRGVDFVAMSFVRKGGDLSDLRRAIKSFGGSQFVIAKIEKKEAIDNFDSILEQTDAVMIARGDLGIELEIYEVPLLQKDLIAGCNWMGVPVITATQVLESMTHNPRPTRAEASDAANAVIDGTDAIMLSGETAIGAFPVAVVETLKMICAETEQGPRGCLDDKYDAGWRSDAAGSVARSVCRSAAELRVKVIAAPTRTGRTARLISRYRPQAKIIAFSESENARKQLLLSRGVTALPINQKLPFAELQDTIRKRLLEGRYVRRGDTIIITAGSPRSRAGETNLMAIETV